MNLSDSNVDRGGFFLQCGCGSLLLRVILSCSGRMKRVLLDCALLMEGAKAAYCMSEVCGSLVILLLNNPFIDMIGFITWSQALSQWHLVGQAVGACLCMHGHMHDVHAMRSRQLILGRQFNTLCGAVGSPSNGAL